MFKYTNWLLKPRQLPTQKGKQMMHRLNLDVINVNFRRPIALFWCRPPEGFVALNIDGASKRGIAAGGGIIRDVQGNYIEAFHCHFGNGTNNAAETKALLFGLQQYKKISVQTD